MENTCGRCKYFASYGGWSLSHECTRGVLACPEPDDYCSRFEEMSEPEKLPFQSARYVKLENASSEYATLATK